MRKLTQWIVTKFIKDYQKINDLKVRSRYGSLEGWVSIVVNVVLFGVKIVTGLAINSVSLIADAVHTLADSVTSAVVIVGFKMAKKPSDKEHPFGHGRMESIATLIVSVLLFIAGVELLEKSVHSVLNPQSATASLGVILVIVGTILIKELMARFSYLLGDMIDSKALKADALHHRSDVIATALVVIALIASRFGFNRVDGIMGVFVSLIIFYSAYEIAKEAINPLLGEAVSKETLKRIEAIAKNHQGVSGVHDIIFHRYGQTSIISLHIEVSDKEDVSKLHTLSEEVEDEISQEMGGVVVVHIDPVNKDHPQYGIIAKAIGEIIAQDKRVHSFHELRIIGCNQDKCNVVFDIALEENADEQETQDIISSIQEKFKSKFPKMKTVIKAEPKYVYNP
ncbi:MAG: cation diffusion facilitator family transporter [Candidatus Omnitrophota bacterium]